MARRGPATPRFYLAQELQLLGQMEKLQNIVVGYDGSPLSEMALRRALLVSRDAVAALIHVVVVAELTDDGFVLPTGENLSPGSAREFVRLTVRALIDNWELKNQRVHVVTHVVAGPVAKTLVDLAYRYHADLIVIGAHGAGQRLGTVGRVAHDVLDWSGDLAVHLESASLGSRQAHTGGAEWAYVFGPTPLGAIWQPRGPSEPCQAS